MKNQYFGDINDYRKYGLIRILADNGSIKTGVCWMLTPDDARTDGKFIEYLDESEKFKRFDPGLYDFLSRCLKSDERNVLKAANSDKFPNIVFFDPILKDNAAERKQYFHNMFKLFQNVDLIFFDPDNGLEVKSKKIGNKDSSKYLYWDELVGSYEKGHSILVYQHFPRVQREKFINGLVSKIYNNIQAHDVISFSTSNVVFFLISQAKHSKNFKNASKMVKDIWGDQIIPEWHDNL